MPRTIALSLAIFVALAALDASTANATPNYIKRYWAARGGSIESHIKAEHHRSGDAHDTHTRK